MIKYKNILEKLKKKGYTTYRLRKDGYLSENTLQSIRDGKPVNLRTIDTICSLLDCPVDEIMEYVPNEKNGNTK